MGAGLSSPLVLLGGLVDGPAQKRENRHLGGLGIVFGGADAQLRTCSNLLSNSPQRAQQLRRNAQGVRALYTIRRCWQDSRALMCPPQKPCNQCWIAALERMIALEYLYQYATF